MAWKLSDDRPIYSQLVECITRAVVTGRYPPGSRIPSVRDLAMEAGVNPNTMQKAMTAMDTSTLIEARRTEGRFVTDDAAAIERARGEIAAQYGTQYLAQMKSLGYDKAHILDMITELIGDDTDDDTHS